MKIPIYPVFRFRTFTITNILLSWGQGFAELADAIVTLCSFGLLVSGFEVRYSGWRAHRSLKRMKR